MTYVLLVLVVGLLAAWFVVRQGGKKTETRPDRRTSAPKTESTEFHAVSLKVGTYACDAAKKIAGQRYLASEAPKIPLAGCTAADDCACRFVHHKDRRTGKDRRSPFTSGGLAAASGKYEKERRQGRERRDDDDVDFLI